MTVYRDQIAAQQAFYAQRENQAREARSFHTLESTGVGATNDDEPLYFDNPFVFLPAISYGAMIVVMPDQELWGLPRVSGAVMKWEKNARGFLIGAYVFVTVDLDPAEGVTPEVQPNIRIEHHFTFSGLSYKHLGDKVLAQVQEPSIEPRHVNL